MNKAIFIDKDGTLIRNIPYNVNPELITLTDTAIPALQRLQKAGFLLILISNQSGVARGYFTEKDLDGVSRHLSNVLEKEGIKMNGFYYCPHYKNGKLEEYSIDCDCRKPKPGLILRAINDFNIDASQSWMVGDALTDVEAGKAAGCHTLLVQNEGATSIFSDKDQPNFIATKLLEAATIITQHH